METMTESKKPEEQEVVSRPPKPQIPHILDQVKPSVPTKSEPGVYTPYNWQDHFAPDHDIELPE